MSTPFAAIESLVNQRALGMLANAMADFGGAAVQGVFDARPALAFDQVQVSNPQFRCLSALVPSVGEGDAVTINAVAYTVASIEHDATGMARIELERAP